MDRWIYSRIIPGLLLGGFLSVSSGPSEAAPITYAFDGTGGVTINGTLFVGPYSVVFTGDTTAVDTSGSPFDLNRNLTGTFTEGVIQETIEATVESNSSLANIDFYDATFTNGLGLQDDALAGYALSTSIGPIDAPPGTLTPTFGGGSFTAANGDTLVFTSSDQLSFTATTAATPLPAALPLLGSALGGLGGLGLFGWRRKRRKQVLS